MKGEYERLVLSLEPWLRGLLRKVWWDKGPGVASRGVPGAYSLKSLGDEAEADGGAEGVAGDVRALVIQKALRVAHEIESGEQDPPDKPEQYFKEVMRNEIRDWKRSHPEPDTLTPEETAIINAEVYSAAVEEGAEEVGGWQAVLASGPPTSSGARSRPFILSTLRAMYKPFDMLRGNASDLANLRFWKQGGYGREWERVQQKLDAIPNDDLREAALLCFQGYPQKTIAPRLLKTQQAISKALRKQFADWGWDKNGDEVKRTQCVLLYVNIKRVVSRVQRRLGPRFGGTLWPKVFQAIKNDPALACFTKGLRVSDMGELLHFVEEGEELNDDLDESSESAWPQLQRS